MARARAEGPSFDDLPLSDRAREVVPELDWKAPTPIPTPVIPQLSAGRDLLACADSAQQAAEAIAAGRLERITIAAPTTTLTDVIAPFLATLGAEDPVPTVFESEPSQENAVLLQGADLAIVTGAPKPPVRVAS